MKNWKEHLIGIGIIIAAVCIFCLPALQGKKLASHDYVSWQYMSNEAKTFTDQNGGPAYWSNSMFGGMPAYTFYGTTSGSIFANIQNAFVFTFNRPLFILFICGFCFYLLGVALNFKFVIRILASIGFMLSSYNPIIAGAGHDSKLIAIGYMAGVLAGLIFILNNKKWIGAAVYTFCFAAFFTSGHYQIVYYFLITLLIAGIVILVSEYKAGNVKSLLPKLMMVITCTFIGVLPQIQGIVLTQDYTKSTMRGGQSEMTIGKETKKPTGGLDREYAFRWSQGVGETFSLLVPGVHGPMGKQKFADGATAEKLNELGIGGQQGNQLLNQLPDYWGPQPGISGPVYFGAVIILLFIFGLFTVKSYHKWWIIISSVFFIMLSWGRNFEALNVFLFEHLPMYNKFRTPSMALVIPSLLFPLLGAWGLHDVLSGKISKEEALKAFKISAGITIGLALLGGILSGIWQDFEGANYKDLIGQLSQSFGDPAKANALGKAMKEDMAAAVKADGIRSLLFILTAAGIIFLMIKEKLKSNIGLAILAVLIFADLFELDKRYLTDEQYLDSDEYEAQYFGPRSVDNQIMADKDPYYRVQDFTTDAFNDAKPSYFHKMVGGYSPAKMETYQDLITIQLSKNNKEVYNMLNTKYFIIPGQNKQPQVMPNQEACGNAWFIYNIKMVNTADEEMLALNAPSLSGDTSLKGDFVARNTAIVRNNFKDKISTTNFTKDSSAKIVLTKYGINDLAYQSNNTQAGFGVFSDMYYDGGWHCKIDGKETPIIKTNYVLRGVNIPAGKHDIVFNFEPPVANKGRMLAMFGSALCLAIIVLGVWFHLKGKDGELEVSL
jgi:hypothetical protein